MPVPCSLFPLATTALASILLSLLLALLQHHVAARPPQVRCSRFFFKHLCEKSHYPARASRTSYSLTARQFWTDLRESAPQPALETSLPVMDTKAHADKSGNLQLPLLQRGENVDSRSPFSAPKDFFTASAPAGFTSVPSLIFCLYAFRKGILDNSRIVGDYDGMLGLKSKLLFLVTVLSFIFFIIPWCTRFVLFYNYSRISGGTCVVFFPSSSICRFNDPLSELPPSDWGFFVLCALATSYFQMCTSVILGSGVYKVFPHPNQLILSVL